MSLPESLRQLAVGPIFVVGCPRSGTTWVYDILAAHPNVAGIRESWLFTPNRGLIPLFSPAHWDAGHQTKMHEVTGGALGLEQLVTREQMIADIRELASRWLATALKPDDRFIVEKTPHHLNVTARIAEVFPEARFVNVLRDGRDVAVSGLAATKTWSPFPNAEMRASIWADRWKVAVETARAAAAALGDRFFEIRYENIKADPFEWVRRLFDFCELPYTDELLRRVVEKTDFDHNFTAREDAFRRKGRVGEWQERFGLMDALSFHRTAGDALFETGYESRRRWWLRNPMRRRRRYGRAEHPGSATLPGVLT